MKKNHGADGADTNAEKAMSGISAEKGAPKIVFALLLLLYVLATAIVLRTSGSEGVVPLLGMHVPIKSLTGAFSSVANLCMIFLVVYYKRTGFMVALAILLVQCPVILGGLFGLHIFTNIAGFFTNLLTILALVLLNTREKCIERYQLRLRELATTDTLTKLPNRLACGELMGELMARGEKFAIVILDLNSFKNINTTMGESTGDALLAEIGRRWRNIADQSGAGTTDFIARQGGDEFALIIRGYSSDAELVKTISSYEAVLKNTLTVDECDYYLTASVGYARFPDDGDTSDTLLACAYSALAEAKRGGEHIRCFTRDLPTAEHMLETERKIRSALENDRLFFHLQPQYDISHRLSGFEALARMRDQDGNIVSPGEFIPVAEKTGLIDEIDFTIFRSAAEFFGELIQKTHTDATLSVNVSVKYLMKNGFLDEVRGILETCGVPAGQLEIEITETIMVDSMEKALQCINEIREMGIKIAIDDFGTGYSSLSYLSNFPANTLKVDKSFIDKMNSSNASKQYVAAIISIGHLMGFDVISEGVEDEEQLETLREIGCDLIQGFIWGRPMPPEEAEALVLKQTPVGA